jgi:hypothetical protein
VSLVLPTVGPSVCAVTPHTRAVSMLPQRQKLHNLFHAVIAAKTTHPPASEPTGVSEWSIQPHRLNVWSQQVDIWMGWHHIMHGARLISLRGAVQDAAARAQMKQRRRASHCWRGFPRAYLACCLL